MKHHTGPRKTRSLPKLIALPIPQFKATHFRAKPDTPGFKNRFANQKDVELKDVSIYKSAILSSVDELLAVIELTLSFFKASSLQTKGNATHGASGISSCSIWYRAYTSAPWALKIWWLSSRSNKAREAMATIRLGEVFLSTLSTS